MKFNWKLAIFYIALIAIIVFLCTAILGDGEKKKDPTYDEIIEYFENDEVKTAVIDGDNYLKIRLVDDDKKEIKFRIPSIELFERRVGKYIFGDENTPKNEKLESFNYDMPKATYWWVSILPYVIPIVLLIIFWVIMMRQASGASAGRMGGFAKSRAKQLDADKKKVTFNDVAGADEEKEELREVVEFLKNPQKYIDLGARIPRGILLVGPPGTGKTLLAKAVAGESGVPFYSISGSDFVEMYVGVGASRVRDLFDTAKKNPASIIFIDEIDAVGRHRGAGLGGGNDEREQTLNQLLVEMDGFGTNQGVIVMAATNRPDILDPALLRPGRFDRQVTVNYPDAKGRKDILKVHAKGKPFEKTVDFDVIAKTTIGFTGADLSNLLNEAALRAASKNKRLIGMSDIEEAMMKIIVGTPKKSKKVIEKERRLTAFHEAGHAIVTKVVSPEEPVYQISIIPSGRAGGYTMHMPTEDRSYRSMNEMKNNIAVLLGGRVAEKLMLTDISTGASNDIERATDIARKMVMQYGMSELGPIVFGTDNDNVFLGRDFAATKNYSEKVAAQIDDAISKIIEDAYKLAEDTLKNNIEKLKFTAEYLMKNETVNAEQFDAIMTSNATFEELDAIIEAKKKQSDDENYKSSIFAKAENVNDGAQEDTTEGESLKEQSDTPADSSDDGIRE